MEDEPSTSVIQTDPTALPGVTFDADAQCQAQMGPGAFFCASFIDVSYVTFICASFTKCRFLKISLYKM